MRLNKIALEPIGIIHSPFKENRGTPIQPEGGRDVEAVVEVYEEFAPGLADLEGFSHVVLIYFFHMCDMIRLRMKPFMDDVERGIFATRAPVRPNHIGMSVVRLSRVEGNLLHIRDVDVLDGTPILDIKPHIPRLDSPGPARIGWYEGKLHGAGEKRDDGRFSDRDHGSAVTPPAHDPPGLHVSPRGMGVR